MEIDEIIQDLISETKETPNPSWVKYYEELNDRVYWLINEVDDDLLYLVDKIFRWNREDVGIPVEERKPIKIYINSPGGSLDIEETLVSVIQLSKTPVYGVALGMVASAASLIYLACHKKFALPNAYFILHKGSTSGMSGNFNDIQAAMDDYKKQVEKMIGFYISSTKYTEEEIRRNIENDWYVRDEDIVKFGLVDEIVTDIDSIV